MKISLSDLADLQISGVYDAGLEPERRGGAGPSGTKAMLIDGKPVMIPVLHASSKNAFRLQRLPEGHVLLEKNGTIISGSFAKPAAFYSLSTADGIPYRSIALMHGDSCLASTVIQQCARYEDPDKRCRFCALGESLKFGSTIRRKTPGQLAEVAVAARRLDGATHMTLTSGTMRNRDAGILYLGRCAQEVTKRSGLPVQIQFEPPADDAIFRELHSMGVANVGMHIESLDENVRKAVVPGKAEIDLAGYFTAFEKAVSVFGRGRVSTYVILGLGEDQALVLARLRELIGMGVYPVIVPLHRLPGTPLVHSTGAGSRAYSEACRTAAKALEAMGMTSESTLAGCARCGACSLLRHLES